MPQQKLTEMFQPKKTESKYLGLYKSGTCSLSFCKIAVSMHLYILNKGFAYANVLADSMCG